MKLFILPVDFSSPNVESLTDYILRRQLPSPATEYDRVYLFNNAGTMGKMDKLSQLSCADIKHNMELNLLTPMVLTCKLLRIFEACPFICIVNVSASGA